MNTSPGAIAVAVHGQSGPHRMIADTEVVCDGTAADQ